MVSQRQVTAATPLMGRRGGRATSRPGTLERKLFDAMDSADKEGRHGKMFFVVGFLSVDYPKVAERLKAFLTVEG